MTEHRHETWEYDIAIGSFPDGNNPFGQMLLAHGENRLDTTPRSLTEYGEQGWELVGFIPLVPTRIQYIFKRPKQRSSS